MDGKRYIRIHKLVKTDVTRYYEVRTQLDEYEFYFTSIANCARWLGAGSAERVPAVAGNRIPPWRAIGYRVRTAC